MNSCILVSVIVIAFTFPSNAIDNAPSAEKARSRRAFFHKENFTAAALNFADEVYLLVNDGPIILRNCRHQGFITLRIKFYYSIYHSVETPRSFIRAEEDTEDCWLSKVRLRNFFFSEEFFPSQIQLEAVKEGDAEVIASTTLLVAGEYDVGSDNPVFEAEGIQYVIVNFRFLRAFLYVVLVTGVLIILLEIRDILVRYRRLHYSEVHDQIYYIL